MKRCVTFQRYAICFECCLIHFCGHGKSRSTKLRSASGESEKGEGAGENLHEGSDEKHEYHGLKGFCFEVDGWFRVLRVWWVAGGFVSLHLDLLGF